MNLTAQRAALDAQIDTEITAGLLAMEAARVTHLAAHAAVDWTAFGVQLAPLADACTKEAVTVGLDCISSKSSYRMPASG